MESNDLNSIMSVTLGKNWLNLFDLCVTNSRGPLFLKAEGPFYKLQGQKMTDIPFEDKILAQGNAK